jgi:hypothetical protein
MCRVLGSEWFPIPLVSAIRLGIVVDFSDVEDPGIFSIQPLNSASGLSRIRNCEELNRKGA